MKYDGNIIRTRLNALLALMAFLSLHAFGQGENIENVVNSRVMISKITTV